MHSAYRHIVHGRNGCEWVNAGWKLVRDVGSSLTMSGSGLKMSRSGWEWMGVAGSDEVGGSEWGGLECVGVRFSTTQHEIKHSILSPGYSIFCVFVMFLFFPIFSAKFYRSCKLTQ